MAIENYKHLEITKNSENNREFKASFFEVKDRDEYPFESAQNKEKLEEYFTMLLDNLQGDEKITIWLEGEKDD